MRRVEEYWYRVEALDYPQGGFSHNMRSLVYDTLDAVKTAMVVILLLFTLLFRVVGVEGYSMYPTLSSGDWLVISAVYLTPRYGDIVVVTQPNAYDEPLVKRVIAIAGEEVVIDTQEMAVFVNGERLDEPYINELTSIKGNIEYPITVPQGSVFVMGDNRNASKDSRFVEVGMIDTRYIMGKAMLRLYPFGEWKINNETVSGVKAPVAN